MRLRKRRRRGEFELDVFRELADGSDVMTRFAR
jgi:hypothetical protein